jgi:hypothetical protein
MRPEILTAVRIHTLWSSLEGDAVCIETRQHELKRIWKEAVMVLSR